ncbi:hypothetical protein Tco_0796241 [Tanacetum coccineum]
MLTFAITLRSYVVVAQCLTEDGDFCQEVAITELQAQAQVLRIWLLCHPLASTNEVNTAYGVSTANTQVSPASTQVSTASTQVSIANLSDATVYAFLASQPNGPRWSDSTATRWDTLQGNAEDIGTKIAETRIKTALEGL